MRKLILGALLGLFATLGVIHYKPQVDQLALLKTGVVDPYVQLNFIYLIDGRQATATGSGTVLSFNDKKYILTAGHMVMTEYELVEIIVIKNDHKCQAVLVDYSTDVDSGGKDLCLLKLVEDQDWLVSAYFNFSKLTPKIGEEAWYIGTPAGYVHQWLEKTIISNIYQPHPELKLGDFYLLNGNGHYGVSGGGMYLYRNNRFELSGVMVMLCTYSDDACWFSVTHDDISKFLRIAVARDNFN